MSNAFTDFALLETLQKTLRANNLKKPTEIQQKAIPLLMEGKSVVGIAETGSGKTLSYALPLLHQVKSIELKRMKTRGASQPKAMVLVPTRELGEQVSKVFKIFTHDTRLRVRSVLGGTSFDVAKENVRGEFEILVANRQVKRWNSVARTVREGRTVDRRSGESDTIGRKAADTRRGSPAEVRPTIAVDIC